MLVIMSGVNHAASIRQVFDLAFSTLPLAGVLVISGQILLGWSAWTALQSGQLRK
jgi:hypothetical protein